MKFSRYFMHPMVHNRRSRLLLIWFSIWTFIVGTIFYYITYTTLRQAGLDFSNGPTPHNVILDLLLSKFVQAGIILLTILFSSALTARIIVGPIDRIHRWVVRWKSGATVEPLLVRNGDKYEKIVELLNQFRKEKPSSPH